jgi:hypothetical protein
MTIGLHVFKGGTAARFIHYSSVFDATFQKKNETRRSILIFSSPKRIVFLSSINEFSGLKCF